MVLSRAMKCRSNQLCVTVCEVEAISIIFDPRIIHKSTWAEEIRSSGSCAVDSDYAWSNTAEGTVQSAGSFELV